MSLFISAFRKLIGFSGGDTTVSGGLIETTTGLSLIETTTNNGLTEA